MAKKDDLIAHAHTLGIDPDALAQGLGKTEATIPDLEAAIEKASGEPPVVVAIFLASAPAGANVALAGAIADDPALSDAELTPTQWQARIDAYLNSERP